MKRKPIEQQVVAVVGAASGIGRETALRFAARGARLVAADSDDAGLASLVTEIEQSGGTVTSVVADVSDYKQVQRIAETAERVYGRLDTWVHLAAVLFHATFRDTTPEEFRRVVDVDLMGQVYGAKAALPHLIAGGGGGLIHVSSIEAKRAFPYHSAYAAAKHGIDGFLEALRLELEHEGLPVSVTQIMPASVNTPLFNKAVTKTGVKGKGIPPFYAPSTVAETILYAAEHPRRDFVVGGAGKTLVWTQRMSPRLLDAFLKRFAFTAENTTEPRTPFAPNDLYGPAREYNRVEGDFGNQTFQHSFASWLDRHPTLKAGATVGAAVGLGALLSRIGGDQQRPGGVVGLSRRT